MASHSRVFCIRSTKPPLPKNVPEPIHTDNFDFAEALSSIYPLLSLIFEYLPYSDLQTCLKVCESWRNQAEQTLSNRKDVGWFTCYKVEGEEISNALAHSNNIHHNNAEMAIIFYNPFKIRLTKDICVHSNVSELARLTVPEYFDTQLLPSNIDYGFVAVQKVASNFDLGQNVDDVERFGSVFDGVIIPKIPWMRTVMFICNPVGKGQDMEECLKRHLRPDEKPKCVLLFCKTKLRQSLYNILKFVVPEESPDSVALGGGIIKSTVTFSKLSQIRHFRTAGVKRTLCVLFLKDPRSLRDNFSAYSTVIEGAALSKEEFDKQLYHFRKRVKLKRHSVGFRFCCSSKDQTSELQSFSEIFPTVPIIGLDAYGEIGWNSYPGKYYTRKQMKIHKGYPTAEYEYSTVFVLLTWD